MSKNDNNALTRMLTEGMLSRRGLMKMLSAGAVMSSGMMAFPQMGFAAETRQDPPRDVQSLRHRYPRPRQSEQQR